MPCARAYAEMYVMGMKRPHSIKNTPSVVSANCGSHKMRKSGRIFFLVAFFLGNLDLINMHPIVNETSVTKAIARVAHPNPTLGNRSCSINGNTMPPTLPPVAAIPVALPLKR
ncbi:hypothetical protein I7I48_09237 [Histoplasma ohiense]|nr:hypothetical protein I7I48_09237 [Histoplasma ohiense (nom. inval.)]